MEQLATINIKGKEYVQVDTRIMEFRKQYPSWAIITDIYSMDEKQITMKASVVDENGRVRATGFANEEKDASNINKTSFVENCETSAVGRALGIMGIGLIGNGSVASAEEVSRAIEKQEKLEKKQEAPKEITLEYALAKTTSKGKTYGEISDEQLEWIINSDKASKESKECAKLVLADRKNNLEEMSFVEVEINDGDLPF